MKHVAAMVGLMSAFAVCTGGRAQETKFYDDGRLGIVAANRPGIVEAPVPIHHNGAFVGNYQTVEAYDQVPGTVSYPLTFVAIAANDYVRATYQTAAGGSAPMGTSFVASVSHRLPTGLLLIPTVDRADVTTGIPGRMQVTVRGRFASGAEAISTTTFPDPVVGRTTMQVDLRLTTPGDIALADGMVATVGDVLRMGTLVSMYASPSHYDANMLRYEDVFGVIHTMVLSPSTPRDAHLFASPIEIGSWFELVKSPGSTWFPESPSVRVAILDRGSLRLGLQGFLAATTNPNDDSLNVWLEVLDVGNVLKAGSSISASLEIVTTPVPEPSAALMLLAGTGLVLGIIQRRRRRCAHAMPSRRR